MTNNHQPAAQVHNLLISTQAALLKAFDTQLPPASDALETNVSPSVDPALWPNHILDSDLVEIVRRSPFKVASNFNFPKAPDGRAFHGSLLYRTLSNGEKITRSWLVYSEQNNAVFCFACKLFSLKAIKLTTVGHSDWSNINTRHDRESENFIK